MNDNTKPVVESFQLDHTKVKAPYVRYIDTQTGPNGDVISNYDLRLVQPNENAIPTGGLHTIEHTIAVLLRRTCPPPPRKVAATTVTTACSRPGSGAATSWPRASAPTRSNAGWSEGPPYSRRNVAAQPRS